MSIICMEVPGLGLIEMLSATLPTAKPSQTHPFVFIVHTLLCIHCPLQAKIRYRNLKSKNWIRAFLEYTQTGTNPKGFLSGHPRTERSPVRPTSTNQLHINMSIAFHGIPWLQDSSTLKVPKPLQICFLSIMLHAAALVPLYISCFSTNIPRTTPWVPCFDPAMSRCSSACTLARRQQTVFHAISNEPVEKLTLYFVLFLAWNLIKLTSGERLSS